MTNEQIIEFARKYAVAPSLDYMTGAMSIAICKRLVELHDADQARRERLRSIGRKGGQANKGVPRSSLRRDIKRA
jgi:hypothetical protein